MKLVGAVLLGPAALAALPPPSNPPAVVPGLDVARVERLDSLRGRRLGLITNHTGKALDGTPTARVLKELGLDLRRVFAPEHGLSGTAAAGAAVPSGADRDSGVEVVSLYDRTYKPAPEKLCDLDALVFDIQDVGVRFYTYISTMKLAMEAAAEAGVRFIVLDRPNPRGGEAMEGPVLDPRFASFVGIAPVPLVHGMTVGELARFWNGEGLLEGGRRTELEVVPLRGWRREMLWEETGLPWTPTSPNIRTPAAAVAYPALGLFEGVNVSEGRGTLETFLLAGAPWIDGPRAVAALRALELPGARFQVEAFTPRVLPEAPSPLYPGQTCFGFRLTVDEPRRFQAVRTGLSAIAALQKLYPRQLRFRERGGRYYLDSLLGTDQPRVRLAAGESVDSVVESFGPELRRFAERRSSYLLYP
jgi:uncharacterized protein YbbC (DUF1343 family)